jgi:hypothetical protein
MIRRIGMIGRRYLIEDLSWMKVKASQTVAASTTIVLGATIFIVSTVTTSNLAVIVTWIQQ